MGTAIVIVIIVVICVFAIYSYGHKMRNGGGCCGSHEAAEKKVKVADKNKDHTLANQVSWQLFKNSICSYLDQFRVVSKRCKIRYIC